ncbi:MAG: hydantoinase B/oxoprolinase family protein [Rhizobiaceae bacterium]
MTAMRAMDGRYRIGFDIGGTFTDFILLDSQASTIRLHKCLTTPHDPSEGALAGLGELLAAAGVKLSEVGEIIHGTTLVTNALVERKGAKLGMITTKGFRDIIEIGTEQRYDIYDLFLQYPDPLVGRQLRLEVAERMDRDGEIVTPLDVDDVAKAAKQFAAEGVGAIAVCFLHSYRNPQHERAAAEALRRELPDIPISISSAVVAEIWEYQRFVTTCANAYVQPLMDRYLRRLEQELHLRGFGGDLRLMQSAGGLVSPDTARAYPIRLLESGPAGGALATAFFGSVVDKTDIISFDMGGTTAKACMIEDGRAEIAAMMEVARLHRFKKGSGLSVKAPVIDMIEIGAGGGSVASIDEVGLLKVGPHSAGADPGPACYGRGGTDATVTDANLVLGYYDPDFFLGGRMALDKAAAEEALGRTGEALGLSPIEAASGVHRTVTESMAAAARIHIVEKGKDPRRYSMVGFGGAGPAHAVEVARILGVEEVLIPPASGAASALGFLAAPLSFEQVRSRVTNLDAPDAAAQMSTVLGEIEAEARQMLVAAGVPLEKITIERFAEMRLAGQLHEIMVPLRAGEITSGHLPEIFKAFEEVYSRRYTSVYDGVSVQIASYRVRVSAPAPKLAIRQDGTAVGERALKGHRQAWFGGEFVETPVYDRYSMAADQTIEGPAIIEEREATTVLGPGDSVTVGSAGTLRIKVGVPAPVAARIAPDTPLETAQALIEADPISLEIMWSRLVTVVEEMWHTICRTAFSLIVSEAQDFACDLLDANGESLTHSPRAMPAFNLTLPRAVQAMLKKFPAETLRPGDVLITNDPWICAGHLYDVAVATPVFKNGKLVAILGTVGHVGDIGGVNNSMQAHEIFDEGLQIPLMKLYHAGKPDEALFALIGENVRKPEAVIGDIHSFVAANGQGVERLQAFMDDYGMHDLRALAAVVRSRSEKAMRDAIRALPDGVYHSEVGNRLLGYDLRYPLKVTIKGDEIELDFEGAPPQLPRGGLNCTLSYAMAHAAYPLKCLLSPQVRGNAGCYYPITVRAPEGSVYNCTRPASVAMRTRTGWYLAPNVFRALSEAAPDRVQAHTGLPVSVKVYGKDADGSTFSDHFFMGGGQGASAGSDGKSALLWPTSAANTSVELFETRAPILITEKALIKDSGGPGRHRGGLGTRTRMRKLYDDGLPALAAVWPEGVDVDAPGLFGGRQGNLARGAIVDAEGNLVHDCGDGELVTLTSASQVVEVTLCGGSGFGDPAERDRRLLDRDIADGYVSREAAAREYQRAIAAE